MSSKSKTLYIGVTSDLVGRVWEHKNKVYKGFTEKYDCTQLVYFEDYENVHDALDREKQLKKWRREKKIQLIEQDNKEWLDLSERYMFYR